MDFYYEVHYTTDLGTNVFRILDRVDAIAFAEELKEFSTDPDAMAIVVIRRDKNE